MQTRITELLNIKYPIFQGGMAWVADGDLSGVVFRNITFTGDKYLPAQVRGVSREFPLQNVTFDNVVFNGRQIKKADCRKYLFVNPYIENLQFK